MLLGQFFLPVVANSLSFISSLTENYESPINMAKWNKGMPEATKIPSRASPEVVRILEVNYEPSQGSQTGWCDGH